MVTSWFFRATYVVFQNLPQNIPFINHMIDFSISLTCRHFVRAQWADTFVTLKMQLFMKQHGRGEDNYTLAINMYCDPDADTVQRLLVEVATGRCVP
jgi:hypothetical protein